MQVRISKEGGLSFVYNEMLPLDALGKVKVRRGSNVEPTINGEWTVDLSPVGGPIVGPFPLRSTAISFELDWLDTNWLFAN